jgi:hypothetical protein
MTFSESSVSSWTRFSSSLDDVTKAKSSWHWLWSLIKFSSKTFAYYKLHHIASTLILARFCEWLRVVPSVVLTSQLSSSGHTCCGRSAWKSLKLSREVVVVTWHFVDSLSLFDSYLNFGNPSLLEASVHGQGGGFKQEINWRLAIVKKWKLGSRWWHGFERYLWQRKRSCS